ncbi:hypothetical protein D3C78_646010 [compost metagenome]
MKFFILWGICLGVPLPALSAGGGAKRWREEAVGGETYDERLAQRGAARGASAAMGGGLRATDGAHAPAWAPGQGRSASREERSELPARSLAQCPTTTPAPLKARMSA